MKIKRIIITTILLFIIVGVLGCVNAENVDNGNVESSIDSDLEIITEDTAESTENNTEEAETENENEEEFSNGEPKIYSESAILMEKNTGKVLYAKDVYSRKYPASTTKILTAIIAIENCDLDQKMTASPNAVKLPSSSYTKANIQAGESFTLDELLGVLMLQSANEAANVIAENVAGSIENFTDMMNKKAKEIGCIDSHFVNANGIHDENHYSTSYDMAAIAAYCMKNETFRKYANMMECRLPDTEFWGEEQIAQNGERHFYNTNKLLIPGDKYYYPYCIGIKTGFTTPAKNCLIAASEKDGFELISVILHAEQTEDKLSARYMDTINLFEYGFNNFSKEEIYKEANYEQNDDSSKNENNNETQETSGVVEVLKQTEEFIEEKIPETSPLKEKGFLILLVFGVTSILLLIIIGGGVYSLIRKKRKKR